MKPRIGFSFTMDRAAWTVLVWLFAVGCGGKVSDDASDVDQDLHRRRAYCSDGVCNGDETCSTCPHDCGACLVGLVDMSTPPDLSRPVAPVDSGQSLSVPVLATCSPTTCAAQGKNCATISDGCGGTLDDTSRVTLGAVGMHQ